MTIISTSELDTATIEALSNGDALTVECGDSEALESRPDRLAFAKRHRDAMRAMVRVA